MSSDSSVKLHCLQNSIFLLSDSFFTYVQWFTNFIYFKSRTVMCNRSPQVLTRQPLLNLSFKGPASLCVLWNKALWPVVPNRKLHLSDTGGTVYLPSADLKQYNWKAFEVVMANHIRWWFGLWFFNFSGNFISPWKQRPILAVVSSLPWPKD